MRGQITAAITSRKIGSKDHLAEELLAKHPELPWSKPRSVSAKIGELDNGKPGWWIKRPEHAKALADHLDLTPADLGLFWDSGRQLYEFTEFPALPPLDLTREVPCEIGAFVSVSDRDRPHHFDLEDWMGRPSGIQRAPTPGITWLYFPEGTGRDLFWACLQEKSPYDHVDAVSLASLATRIRQPRPVAIHVETDGGLSDLDALLGRHLDTAVLIVAQHLPKTRKGSSLEQILHWDYLSVSDTERRRLDLTNPDQYWRNGIDRFEWRLTDGWQQKLARWIERRLNAAQVDTLFSVEDLNRWMSEFPLLHSSIKTPREFLAVCSICHQTPGKSLPRKSQPDAGQSLLRSLFPGNSPIQKVLRQVLEDRWQSEDVTWIGPLDLNEWQTLNGRFRYAPTKADLLTIADGANKDDRREKANALAERSAGATGLDLLVQGKILVGNHSEKLELSLPFLANFVARDILVKKIKHDPVESWAKFCFDSERRPVVDSALAALSTDELISICSKVFKLAADDIANIAASEALFIVAPRHVDDRGLLPEPLVRLAALVLGRLDREEVAPQLWTRSIDFGDDSKHAEWLVTCWTWSMATTPPKLQMPEHWAWAFPGWFKTLPDTYYDLLSLLDRSEALKTINDSSPHLIGELLRCADRLVERLNVPIGDPPDFVKPYLLAAGIQQRWTMDQAWLRGVMTCQWAEDALLKKIKPTGSKAAKALWPVLLDYMTGLIQGEGDLHESMMSWRSGIWAWTLNSLSPDDAVMLPSDHQMVVLYDAPQALPPKVRARLLRRLPGEKRNAKEVVRKIVEVCDPLDISELLWLVGTEFGEPVTQELWNVAPGQAEDMLMENQLLTGEALRQLIEFCPLNSLATAIHVLQTRNDIFDADSMVHWATRRLPEAKGCAGELLALIKRGA